MAEVVLNSENFKVEVLESELPVLVDFWADWCGPCRIIAPIIAEIASENEGTIKVGKLNIDNNEALTLEYDVMSIPTLMLFRNGKVQDTLIGVRPKQEILQMLGI